MTTTLTAGRRAGSLLDAGVPVEHLPYQWEDPLDFDTLTLDHDILAWPPPEFSHTQFLTDHDHDGWLARFDELVERLRVVDLERPWTVDRIGENPPYRWVAICDLCDHRSQRKQRQPQADTAGETHAHNQHGWTPSPTRARTGSTT